jgi:hypothetical protein
VAATGSGILAKTRRIGSGKNASDLTVVPLALALTNLLNLKTQR